MQAGLVQYEHLPDERVVAGVRVFLGCLRKTCGGWHPCRYNNDGYENADLCAWTFSSATFAAGSGLANVRWNCPAAAANKGCTSRYYLIQVRSSLQMPSSKPGLALHAFPPRVSYFYLCEAERRCGWCVNLQQNWVNASPGTCSLSF